MITDKFVWTQSFNFPPKHNPDGIGNCLRQPGPIRNQPNVYHRNLHPLIKFCIPWLILLPWQSQWGCRPSRRCHGFCITIVTILSYRDKPCSLIGTHSSGPFYRDIQTLLIYRDYAKTHANPDTDGNSPYHRAVRCQVAGPLTFTITLNKNSAYEKQSS